MVQGLLLLSPAIEVQRTVVLRVMAMLQGLVLPFFPHWRIVPSPPIHVITEDPRLVRTWSGRINTRAAGLALMPQLSLQHRRQCCGNPEEAGSQASTRTISHLFAKC